MFLPGVEDYLANSVVYLSIVEMSMIFFLIFLKLLYCPFLEEYLSLTSVSDF